MAIADRLGWPRRMPKFFARSWVTLSWCRTRVRLDAVDTVAGKPEDGVDSPFGKPADQRF
ncbi:MAG: hypothetical protein IRZ05_16600 [Micromonosporaceae bacterium]|nr:hypothetical protein [Micromonosporaceae bacterium]